ncbi:MAG: PilX family type IV pilin [Neisseria sp.]|nr:PilX family type IV pilin [Neisseria sp.]
MMGSRFSRCGFTLLEMMMVVAILGILAAIAIPSYARYVERANLANAHAELVNINHIIKRFRVANPGGEGRDTNDNTVNTTTTAGLNDYVESIGVEATVNEKYRISADVPDNGSLRYNLLAVPRENTGYTKAVWMSSAGRTYRCESAAAAEKYETSGACEEIK